MSHTSLLTTATWMLPQRHVNIPTAILASLQAAADSTAAAFLKACLPALDRLLITLHPSLHRRLLTACLLNSQAAQPMK